MRDLPSYRDLPLRGGLPCSWGLWGPEGSDTLGCLNLLTPERAAEAAGLVERGAVFALNWSMGLPDPPLFGRQPFTHEVTGASTGTSHDDVLHGWNTQSSSQWDGFRHIRNHADHGVGTGHYGGVPDDEHGIHHWARRGIVGRAVLCDIGRWREQQGLPTDVEIPGMGANRRHAAANRKGHSDSHERLRDMDADGVEASVTYCEVSAFRYLYLLKNGWREATRSGSVDAAVDTEEEALALLRRVLGYLPSNVWQLPPRAEPTDDPGRTDPSLRSLVPRGPRPVDTRRLFTSVADTGSVTEIVE